LSTRPVDQLERKLDEKGVIEGGYWVVEPSPDAELAIVYCGALAPEAIAAHEALREDLPGCGLLAVTSSDRLHEGWVRARQARAAGPHEARSPADRLLGRLPSAARLVTVVDGHPATLAWLGGIAGHRVTALGVDSFGQSGDIPDLYRTYGLDAEAIIDAAARALLD
jgi:pyruvate dehydrogenase E1 component